MSKRDSGKRSQVWGNAATRQRLFWGLMMGLCVIMLLARGPVASFFAASAAQDTPAQMWQLLPTDTAQRGARPASALPHRYSVWRLSAAALTKVLSQAPREFSGEAAQRRVTLALPQPDGTTARYWLENSPVMEPELAARFPEIQTYIGQGIDDPTATLRLASTPNGLQVTLLSSAGTFFVEPLSPTDKETYLAYALADAPTDIRYSCGVTAAQEIGNSHAHQLNGKIAPRPNLTVGGTLRQYRLAMATTGEYAQTYGGGTVNGTLAAVTTLVNGINAIFERDLAVRLVLIANQTSVIFTNPATDGYTSGNVAAMIDENRAQLNTVLGPAAYDIGHVVDGHPLTGGFSFAGLAYVGVTCNTAFKGGGGSILDNVQPSAAVASYIVGHELGHQLGALHSFNTTAGGCGPARSPSAAYEPASGTTLMAYRFTCGEEDTRSTSFHFHNNSIQEIQTYLGSAAGCGTSLAVNNLPPTVEAGPDYTIPAGTPFRLTASGRDPNGQAITYSWEQFDLGNPSPPLADDGTRPLFRSSDPSTNPTRIYPRLPDILNGTTTVGETLPTTTRTLNFRVTARDNNAGGGGLQDDFMKVNVRAESGPFTLTQPTTGTAWTSGAAQNITWNVANTNAAPIGANTVRIWLSTDNGATWPYVLADATPNDGAESVVLPNIASTTARVMVEAVGNVFFNISRSFTISAGTAATVQFSVIAATSVPESSNDGLSLNITRTGNLTAPVAVSYATVDGTADQRTDYIVTSGLLNFAANETLKTVVIPIINDQRDEDDETFRLVLSNPNGGVIAGSSALTLTLADDDTGTPTTPNPLETREFFVRQQYYDFLNRIPDAAGFTFWLGVLNECGTDANCLRSRRVSVSAAFFVELEFQESGAYVYRLYKAAFGEQLSYRPTYDQFTPDRARVVGGMDLAASKLALASDFAQRSAFTARYPVSLTATQFVDAVLQTVQQGAGVTFTAAQRGQFISDVNTGGRGLFLRNLADNQDFTQAVFNRAFVLMQYFGYLRRDPDQAGYDFWLSVLNQQPQNFRGMVCAFITSAEHQERFSSVISRTNEECGPGI